MIAINMKSCGICGKIEWLMRIDFLLIVFDTSWEFNESLACLVKVQLTSLDNLKPVTSGLPYFLLSVVPMMTNTYKGCCVFLCLLITEKKLYKFIYIYCQYQLICKYLFIIITLLWSCLMCVVVCVLFVIYNIYWN